MVQKRGNRRKYEEILYVFKKKENIQVYTGVLSQAEESTDS